MSIKVKHYASISENFDHSSAAEGIVTNALFLLTILLLGTLTLGLILLFVQIFQLIKSICELRKIKHET